MNCENPYELLYMIRTGDAYAENELYRTYHGLVVHLVDKLICTNRLLQMYREDLIQEGMIGIMEAVENYREDKETGFTTYLYLIVHRILLSKIKAYCTHPEIQFHNMCSFDETEGKYYDNCQKTIKDPVYYLRMQEAYDRLNGIARKMSRTDRSILCSVIRDEPIPYAADHLHLTYAAYSGRKSRIKKNLQEKLLKNK